MSLFRMFAYLAYQRLNQPGLKTIGREQIDAWVGLAIKQLREGRNGYTVLGAATLATPAYRCELIRDEAASGVNIEARIVTQGRTPTILASQSWQGRGLTPDLARAFGMNYRIELQV